jgi:hypothetical protein
MSEKKWTVMLYMAGDNSLDGNGLTDLAECKKVGSTPDINVIAQFDRAGPGRETRRYCLRRDTTLEADVVESLGETNTGDPKTAIDFVEWGAAKYAADRTLFVLWNHGSGWDDTNVYARGMRGDNRTLRVSRLRHSVFRTSVQHAAKIVAEGGPLYRAICFDDDAKDFLDNGEMKQVGQEAARILGRKVDILGMDACLMSMAEVGYQMKDFVSYMVASEQTEPDDGWPYDSILRALAADPAMTPADLGKTIVKAYVASYRGSRLAVTQAACALGAAENLALAVKKLGDALKAGLEKRTVLVAIRNAREVVQEYDTTDNVDLVDLCTRLRNGNTSASIKAACAEVLAASAGAGGFVVASAYVGPTMKGSRGVAIYFPTRKVSPLYAGLDFAARTGWGGFLKAYVASRGS